MKNSLLDRIGASEAEPTAAPAPSADPSKPLLSRLLPDTEPIRQDLLSSGHAVAYVRSLMRGNRIRRRAVLERIDAGHPPVLLIHGFLGTRGSMFMLEH